ncbi:MAG: Stp1/IreP family PP2C-type Ser/Thr phosphatase [Ruminococcaceae bacterium]|nr:Stp1/IreP family PP2C-type Ser/Thr phosphatase [Oscillospiraceae bacterium]
MRIFAKTDKGKVRSINQDAFAANILSGGVALAVVCDGMGGASAGDIASKTAVDIISQYVLNAYNPSMTSDDIIRLLDNAIASANLEVFTLSQKDEALSGMGTTVVAAIVRETQAVICNAGDSRAYLINDNLCQITRDHSIVQTLVESGKLSPEEARVHPEKNVITRALGVEENILTDSYVIDINENDMLLLCTDGLSNYADSESILRIVKDNALDKTTDLLINKANAGGGRDNITAAVISH